MNKKILSIAILAVAYVSSVYIISLQSEAMIKQEFSNQQRIANINHGLTVSDIDYQRGLFSSEASFNLTIEQSPNNVISVTNKIAIQHGPVMMTRQGLKLALFNADSSFTSDNFSSITAVNGITEVMKRKLIDYFSNDFATSALSVSFTGRASYIFTIAPLKIEQQTTQFNFDGLVVSGAGSFTQQHYAGSLQLGTLNYSNSDSSFDLQASSGDFDITNTDDFLNNNTVNIKFPQLSIKSNGNTFMAKDAGIDFIQSYDDDNRISLKESFYINDIESSSPVPISAISYDVEVNNIDSKAFELWAQLAPEFQSAMQADGQLDFDSETVKDATRSILTSLLKKDLAINQKINLNIMNGDASIEADVKFVGIANNVHPMDVANPIDFLSAVDIDLILKSDETIVMKTPVAAMVGMYIDQGFINKDGQKLIVDIDIRNGEMTINNKPYPLKEQLENYIQKQQVEPASAEKITTVDADIL